MWLQEFHLKDVETFWCLNWQFIPGPARRILSIGILGIKMRQNQDRSSHEQDNQKNIQTTKTKPTKKCWYDDHDNFDDARKTMPTMPLQWRAHAPTHQHGMDTLSRRNSASPPSLDSPLVSVWVSIWQYTGPFLISNHVCKSSVEQNVTFRR